jgi:DNA-binding HxlR family transcriptional regulator
MTRQDARTIRSTSRRREREAADDRCSVALAAEQIGERWTVLLLREVFWGSRRFETLRENLGIARNILTDRLRRLVDLGMLERVPVKAGSRRCEYRLTEKGRDLLPVLIALQQWGDRWLQPGGRSPVVFVDRRDGEPILPLAVRARDGRVLTGRDLVVTPGPGADAATRRRIERIGRRLEPAAGDPRVAVGGGR